MSSVAIPQVTGVGSSSNRFYASFAEFPPTGETSVIYVDQDASTSYLWDGAMYDQLGGSGGGPSTTDDLPEGSTNLYYTNTRADARIAAHVALSDPHSQYMTEPETAADVDSAISVHAALINPHNTSLGYISDVELASVATGDLMYYNGSKWVNTPLEEISMPEYTTLIDEVDATTTYIGYALPGTSQSVEEWRIKRISVDGDITEIEYAGGSKDFVNNWDERDTYTYE